MIDLEIRSQAIARIVHQGEPAERVALELGLDPSTAYRWARLYRATEPSVRDKALEERNYRIATQALDITERALEQIEGKADADQDITGYLIPLNAVAGTNTDKILKRQENTAKQLTNDLLAEAINRIAQLPTTDVRHLIEGEARTITEEEA